MRILIIGGTNFIGPYVVRLLAAEGHEITVFHRGEHEPDLTAVRHIHHPSAAIPITQVPQDVQRELKGIAPEVVLHMVAMGEADAQTLMNTFRGAAKRV